jgi:signal transduction histidine kinase
MNQTILSILAGRRKDRVPQGGRRDEFEELARHFNTLLDRNDRLIAQVREVTDNIAHDLRSPLARMRGALESALRKPRAPDSDQDILHGLLEETDSILETFTALLSIAQIEAGAVREDMKEVGLEAIVEDITELYEPVAEEAGLLLRARIDEGTTVLGNRRLIAQAVTNLVDNAIKYGERSIEIRVRAGGPQPGSGPEIVVSDRGPGIPVHAVDHVLGRFVRLDASRHKPGTGLGLSFVRAVAELHGGQLVLSDNGPGLAVCLRFPVPKRRGGRPARSLPEPAEVGAA